GILDAARDAEPDVAAGLPFRGLLPPTLLVPHELEGAREQGRHVAAVVGTPAAIARDEADIVRVLVALDEVAAADLGGIELEPLGYTVQQSLHHEDGLR